MKNLLKTRKKTPVLSFSELETSFDSRCHTCYLLAGCAKFSKYCSKKKYISAFRFSNSNNIFYLIGYVFLRKIIIANYHNLNIEQAYLNN